MAVIDFRNTKQVFYGGNEYKEAWYMNEKIWEKKIDLSKYRVAGVRARREDKTSIVIELPSYVPNDVKKAVAFKSKKGNVYTFDQNGNAGVITMGVMKANLGDGFYEFLISEYTENELDSISIIYY